MPDMDLQAFYDHALQWKHQKDEAARLLAEKQAQEAKDGWKKVAETLKQRLPIEGISFHATFRNQFDDIPRNNTIYTVDAQIDPARREGMKVPFADGRDMAGVIRIQFSCDIYRDPVQLTVIKYLVWNGPNFNEFTNPEEAFLAAYERIQVK